MIRSNAIDVVSTPSKTPKIVKFLVPAAGAPYRGVISGIGLFGAAAGVVREKKLEAGGVAIE